MNKWTRSFYTPNLPLYKDKRVTASDEHIRLSKKAAKEGMVLLKNEDHVLPIRAGKNVALFGKGTFDYVKGGGGSADVTVPYVKNLYDGLKEHSDLVNVVPTTIDFYRNYVNEQYAKDGQPGMIPEPELPEEMAAAASSIADTAIISISRFSGEGWDRKSEFGGPHTKAMSKQDQKHEALRDSLFEKSDFYLTPSEEAMIQTVTGYFDEVVVVLNVGGMVATEWVKENQKIKGALLAFQGGLEGGAAEAELLLGLGNPSGKLADTFAKHLEDYPSTENFHESDDYVNYTEDIYVGYRYFETIPGAKSKVVYPFGYGLSYTDFVLSDVESRITEDPGEITSLGQVSFRVKVTNAGNVPGREVVQLYYGAPQGKLGKPARVLAAYQKTRLLQPGESQQIFLQASIADMASYDDLGKIEKSAFVLEEGTYHFYIGTDVRSAKETDCVYALDHNVVVKKTVSRCAPTQLPKRLLADGSFEELPQGEPNDPNADGLQRPDFSEMDGIAPAVRYQPGRNGGLNKEGYPQLIDVYEGRMSLDDFVAALPDEALFHLIGGQPNTGVANTFGYGNYPEYGIPNVMTADGPAGLRVNANVGVRTTAFPCATLLACTWDPDLTYAVGRAGGEEVKENNIGVWLAPAVNIHRSPLCGRNFEYYSEDPLLAGKQASGMVRGIQSTHVAATVKHFALNNKETNRRNSDSRVSERALREVYLRQFEIIVKEAHPWSIMTSYNIINGHRASENKELLNGILRSEWGWDGMITTDWWTMGEQYKECAAGNDVKMGTGFPDRVREAFEKNLISRKELESAVKNVLGLILKID